MGESIGVRDLMAIKTEAQSQLKDSGTTVR